MGQITSRSCLLWEAVLCVRCQHLRVRGPVQCADLGAMALRHIYNLAIAPLEATNWSLLGPRHAPLLVPFTFMLFGNHLLGTMDFQIDLLPPLLLDDSDSTTDDEDDMSSGTEESTNSGFQKLALGGQGPSADIRFLGSPLSNALGLGRTTPIYTAEIEGFATPLPQVATLRAPYNHQNGRHRDRSDRTHRIQQVQQCVGETMQQTRRWPLGACKMTACEMVCALPSAREIAQASFQRQSQSCPAQRMGTPNAYRSSPYGG
ncbi:hypothetical protein BC834DRAFT_92037 [Gloeopeniophorella convolvens]|nr:hypothetical protein BC834DRAFT_92037 [Gloeopeniophorella convolvens]